MTFRNKNKFEFGTNGIYSPYLIFPKRLVPLTVLNMVSRGW